MNFTEDHIEKKNEYKELSIISTDIDKIIDNVNTS